MSLLLGCFAGDTRVLARIKGHVQAVEIARLFEEQQHHAFEVFNAQGIWEEARVAACQAKPVFTFQFSTDPGEQYHLSSTDTQIWPLYQKGILSDVHTKAIAVNMEKKGFEDFFQGINFGGDVFAVDPLDLRISFHSPSIPTFCIRKKNPSADVYFTLASLDEEARGGILSCICINDYADALGL